MATYSAAYFYYSSGSDYDAAAQTISFQDVFEIGQEVTDLDDQTWYIAGVCEYGVLLAYSPDLAEVAVVLPTKDGAPLETIIPFTKTDFVVCFLAGTRIATPAGPVAIEDLRAGDLVLTADGGTRKIVWMGRRSVTRLFADPLTTHPIRLKAGALGDDLPVRDLLVSPDHALHLGGLLVQAGALVNGTSITRHMPAEERFTYHHIELTDHALVLAEGVAAETYVDNVSRRRFDNHAEYEALAGTGMCVGELDLPRVKSARQVPASLRAALAERTVMLGLAAREAA